MKPVRSPLLTPSWWRELRISRCAPLRGLPFPCVGKTPGLADRHMGLADRHSPGDSYFAALPVFSPTLNSTIRRIRSVGKGLPRGNCTEPFELL